MALLAAAGERQAPATAYGISKCVYSCVTDLSTVSRYRGSSAVSDPERFRHNCSSSESHQLQLRCGTPLSIIFTVTPQISLNCVQWSALHENVHPKHGQSCLCLKMLYGVGLVPDLWISNQSFHVWFMAWLWQGRHFEFFYHEKWNAHNFTVRCPICIKLNVFDKSRSLNTSTCQHSAIVTEPPTGNRKRPKNAMCCTLMNSSPRIYLSGLTWGLGTLETFVMKRYQKLLFSIKCVVMVWQPFWAFHPEQPTSYMLDEGSSLNTSACQY